MTSSQVSAGQARRIALHAQGFGDRRPTGRIDRRHLRKVMGRLQLLQLDSVPVVIRTQYLVPYSRLGPYQPDLLDRIAYHHDEWFETWAHEASLVPVELEPLFRWHKQRSADGQTWRHLVEVAERDPAYVEDVYAQVKERGPISAGELDDPRPRSGEWWGHRSIGSVALDWLFRIGAVGIRRRGNFEKVFDLPERIVPSEILARPTPSIEEAHRDLLMRSARALGIATAADLADYFRLPIREARARIGELVEDGRLVECQVEGWRTPGLLHPDAYLPRWVRACSLLSPFDPIVWNRDRARRLFGFDYRLEIYTPRHKRQYGYYVLPFLLGDRLVARIDVKTDRAAGTLRALAAHGEAEIDPGAVVGPLAQELEQLSAMVGVERVDVEPVGTLGASLAARR